MKSLHVTSHEIGKKGRVRVWIEDRGPGFDIYEWAEVAQFVRMARSIGLITDVLVHYCDSRDGCECRAFLELPEEL